MAQVARELVERRPRRQHIVNHRDALAAQFGVADKRTADILRAFFPWQRRLRHAVTHASARIRRQRHAGQAANQARDFERLIEAAAAQPLRREWQRDDEIGAAGDARGERLPEQAREREITRVLLLMDQRGERPGIGKRRGHAVETRRPSEA